MVGDFIRQKLVRSGHRFRDQTHDDAVERSRIEHVRRIVQLLVQCYRDRKLLKVLRAPDHSSSKYKLINWAVVVVKWSASVPSTPTFRVRIALTPTVNSV